MRLEKYEESNRARSMRVGRRDVTNSGQFFLLSRKPFFSADLALSQDLLYQIGADICPMRIWDHYSDSSFPHQGMGSFSSVRAFES